MMRLGVEICGLSEVRWNGQGHFTTLDGHTIVYDTIRYDTRCYFNVRSKADMNRLNLPHGDDN